MSRADEFFAYARERQAIMLKKQAGIYPHTDDPILRRYKFCSVFREDDRTTRHLRAITNTMRDKPEVLLATILYRWFNRIETGDSIFNTPGINHQDFVPPWEKTAFQRLLLHMHGDPSVAIQFLKDDILRCQPSGPYVTGAYCIIGAPHMPKLDGILRSFQYVLEQTSCQYIEPWPDDLDKTQYTWREVADLCLKYPGQISQESVWDWFRRYPRSGDFMAYELVSDLCYTDLLSRAPDRMTWANAGPGAIRGLNRIHERLLNQSHPKAKTNAEMQELLALSQSAEFWPQDWPAWDMRTVEHQNCEFDKYERLRLGEGSVKGVYRGP